MDEDDVRLQVQPLGVLPVDLVVEVEIALLQHHRQSLQAVVEGLGDAEEVGRTGDHLPAGVHSQFPHQRHHPAEDFGHAAAAAGRIDVDHRLPARRSANRRSRSTSRWPTISS